MCRIVLALLVTVTSPHVLADNLIGRDAQGLTVGFYVGDTFLSQMGGNSSGEAQGFVSFTGYRFWVVPRSGAVVEPVTNGGNFYEIYYAGLDCTGTAYAHDVVTPGYVFADRIPASGTSLLYVPKNAPRIPLQQTLSKRMPGAGCQNSSSNTQAYELLPNDPVETGVPPTDFVPPITLSRSDLLRDGFEDPGLSAGAVS